MAPCKHYASAFFVIILILTPILHRVVNIIGNLYGVKKEPW